MKWWMNEQQTWKITEYSTEAKEYKNATQRNGEKQRQKFPPQPIHLQSMHASCYEIKCL